MLRALERAGAYFAANPDHPPDDDEVVDIARARLRVARAWALDPANAPEADLVARSLAAQAAAVIAEKYAED